MLSFLKRRIEANQGICISKLPGHMSSLPPSVPVKHGWNEEAIQKFIEKHPEVFVIDNSGRVYLRPSPKTATPQEVAADDATALCGVSGKVFRIFPNFGFITVEQPLKTTVYFDVKSFEGNRHTSLVYAGLIEGDCVILDAAKSEGHKAAFKATRVERIEEVVASASKPTEKLSINEEDRLYDQSGIIHTVKPDFGFITFGPKKKSCAFFHSSVVDKALTKGSRNLADILTTNDRVRFDAKPDSKGSKWVKWKATRVWSVPSDMDGAAQSDVDSGDEVFMSEDEADMKSILDGSSDSESSDVDVRDYSVGFPDWEEDTPKDSLRAGDEASGGKPVPWSSRRTLSKIRGIFFKQSDKAGCICSVDGKVRSFAEISSVYNAGRQIKSFDELPWSSDIKDGVEVFFDAVEDDGKWLATLVWTGKRPPQLSVECSKHTFTSKCSKAMDERCVEDEQGGPCREAARFPGKPSVDIFPGRRAVVILVASREVLCEVKEASGSRSLRFTCLYKDGTAITDRLDKVLRVDDEVSVDYIVGTSQGREVARCSLAWLGKKPLDAVCLTPEDFLKLLCARAAERNSSSSSPQQPFRSDPDVLVDASQHNGSQPHLANTFAEEMLGAAAVKEAVTVQQPQSKSHLENSLAEEMLDVAVDKKAVTDQQPQRDSKAKQTGAHAIVNADSGVQHVSAPMAHSTKEPSISIYPSVRGTIVELLDCMATVRVQEAEGVREIVFTNGYFYKDGEVVLDDLKEVLREGDEVSLNYMVATMAHKEVVHCDLVWQGRMPRNANCLSPDAFAKSLSIKAAPTGVRASMDDLCRPPTKQKRSNLPESASVNHIGLSTSVNQVGSSGAFQTVPAEPRPMAAVNCTMPRGTDGASATVTHTTAVPVSEQRVEQLAEEPQADSTRAGPDDTAGSISSVPSIPPVPSDETLLRLARMVVQEIRAEFLDEVRKCVEASMERSKIPVRDAESQTSAEHPCTDSESESTSPFFSPRSTPTRELGMTCSPPSMTLLVPHQLRFSATASDSIATLPPKLQNIHSTNNTAVGTSCELDSNGGSLTPVRADSRPGAVSTLDEIPGVKPSEGEPENSVAFEQMERQKVLPTTNTASGTSYEDNRSRLLLPILVPSIGAAGAVATPDEAANVVSVTSQSLSTLVRHPNYIEELATPIISKASAASDKSGATSKQSYLSEAAAAGDISSPPEYHSSLPLSDTLDKLPTEDTQEEVVDGSVPVSENETALSGRPNDSADCIMSRKMAESKGDNAHTGTDVIHATKIETLAELPETEGGIVSQEIAENGAPDLSEMAHEALIEASQPTAKAEVSGTFEMPHEAIVNITGHEQTAEELSSTSEKADSAPDSAPANNRNDSNGCQ